MKKNEAEAELAQALATHQSGNAPISLLRCEALGGGAAQFFKLETSVGFLFCKCLPVSKFPQLLQHEAEGLAALGAAGLPVPEQVLATTTHSHQYLFTTWHEQKQLTASYWSQAGLALAQLHGPTHTCVGWPHSNYIGLLPQINDWGTDWNSFFRDCRIHPLVQQCTDAGLLAVPDARKFEKLYNRLNDFFDQDAQPVLLHGDLWRGNLIVHQSGGPLFIDPSVYYGHPAMDLAMTQLFGGFPQHFYAAYAGAGGVLPTQATIDICHLYPLLVHLKLFGKSYLPQVQTTLHRFTQ